MSFLKGRPLILIGKHYLIPAAEPNLNPKAKGTNTKKRISTFESLGRA
jgi:hypothetical protein